MQHERDLMITGFWIIIAIICFSCLLGILGIVVEYTNFGNIRLSHEETNFSNIDIPKLNEGDSGEKLK